MLTEGGMRSQEAAASARVAQRTEKYFTGVNRG
jgi:hypothetical protein